MKSFQFIIKLLIVLMITYLLYAVFSTLILHQIGPITQMSQIEYVENLKSKFIIRLSIFLIFSSLILFILYKYIVKLIYMYFIVLMFLILLFIDLFNIIKYI